MSGKPNDARLAAPAASTAPNDMIAGRALATKDLAGTVGVALLLMVFCLVAIVCEAAGNDAARFEDRAIVERVDDDPFVPKLRLTAPLRFRQSNGKTWLTPANTLHDGRSVPTLFVQLFGHPFEGGFLKTAISYDYAVKSKQHSWKDAQHMFYEAAIVEGIAPGEAKVMYLLLSASGSRWALRGPNSCFSRCHTDAKELEWRPRVSDETLSSLVNWVRTGNPSLDAIDQRAAEAVIEEGPHIFGAVR